MGKNDAEIVEVVNVAMATLNTEYSYTIPKGTEKITFKLRDPGQPLKFCFTALGSATNYITVPASSSFTVEGLKFHDKVLYFQAPANTMVLEVLVFQ